MRSLCPPLVISGYVQSTDTFVMMPAIALVLILFQLGNVSLTDDSAKAGKAFEFNRVSDIKASGTLRSDKESTNGGQDRRNSTVPVENKKYEELPFLTSNFVDSSEGLISVTSDWNLILCCRISLLQMCL